MMKMPSAGSDDTSTPFAPKSRNSHSVVKQADGMPGWSKENELYSDTARLTQMSSTGSNNKRPDGQADWSTLMARAQDGDREAYRTLLGAIGPYIRSIASAYLKRPIDIEDAVQDVLMTVHSIRETYDPKRPFGPWLVAIAHRRIIDQVRRRTRQRAREVAFSIEHETFAEAPANLFTEKSIELALVGAIDKLPPDQREAVRMLKLNEMSLKEASRASGRSISALKVATHRAIKNLRRLLKSQPS